MQFLYEAWLFIVTEELCVSNTGDRAVYVNTGDWVRGPGTGQKDQVPVRRTGHRSGGPDTGV